MSVQKSLGVLLLVVVTSLYIFPFEFSFLPGYNTKMIMAGLGLVLFGVNMARGEQRGHLDKGLFVLSLWAILVSMAGLLSITFNNTSDFSYATYVISMWVWLGGAYFVTQMIKGVHGIISLPLLSHYLIAVCVAQCLIAFGMSQYYPLKTFVDGFLGSEGFMGKVEDRMYGIGASLDVGGMRFATVLIIIAYLCTCRSVQNGWAKVVAYAVAFCIISVIGNMIGRSTVIGMALSFVYVLFIALRHKNEYLSVNIKRLGLIFSLAALCFTFVSAYYYHTNNSVRENLRFAFEGFFSLAEKGRWESHSNEILKNMYVFPDNFKTWLVGDGYFDNPYELDPYYIGPKWGGFYMATDVGYLRFIFYFGLVGALPFIYYMYYAAKILMKKHPQYSALFFLILLINYIMWFKVSSDLFPFFALFLCLGEEKQGEDEESYPDLKLKLGRPCF